MHILRNAAGWLGGQDCLFTVHAGAHPMHSADDPHDEPLFDQAARTLVEQYGDRAAEIAREQAEAADQSGDSRGAQCWRLIADAIEGRRSIH
jgi:hypothetical protein